MSSETGNHLLDGWILVDNKAISYKLLSRLLQVQVHVARELMAAWLLSRPTAHATYVICGQCKSQDSMTQATPVSLARSVVESSGDMMTSFVPQTMQHIQLVAEEDLERIKSQYISIVSCDLYSIEPAKLTDISIVQSCNLDLREALKGQPTSIQYRSETYGTIFNDQVHELDRQARRPIAQERAMKPIFVERNKPEARSLDTAPAKTTPDLPKVETKIASVRSVPGTMKVPALKRNASSSLASAFAKTPKPKVKTAPSLEENPITAKEERPRVETVKAIPLQSSRKQEENTALRDMMMEEDVETEVIIERTGAGKTNQDEEMPDAEDWSASDTEISAVVQPPELTKKRTRKKVRKQVHTTDAKGYMVTTEEWEWVSCSEEEEEASRAPAISMANKKKSSMPNAKRNGGIASYFKKN